MFENVTVLIGGDALILLGAMVDKLRSWLNLPAAPASQESDGLPQRIPAP